MIKIIAILIIKETEKLLTKINDFYPLQHSYKKEMVFVALCALFLSYTRVLVARPLGGAPRRGALRRERALGGRGLLPRELRGVARALGGVRQREPSRKKTQGALIHKQNNQRFVFIYIYIM